MWQILITRYSKILVMPVVVVIGAIGYFMEQKFSTPKKIPYLDASVKEEREKRQMEIELDSEYGAPMNIDKIKSKIVPESSLLLNTGRKGLIDNENRS
ncbi:Small integral membrane protein [Dirofilaria immitis]